MSTYPSVLQPIKKAPEVSDREADAQEVKPHVIPLPRVLGTRDMMVLFVLTVVFLANINGVQFGGTASFLYWGLGFITFLIPCAYVTQMLANRFPGMGGHYLWATRIMGKQWGLLSAFCAWIPCVLAIASIMSTCLALAQYLVPTWFTSIWLPLMCIVFVLLIATAMTCLPLRWLKQVLLVLTILYLAVFLFIGGIGGWWLIQGHAAASSLSHTWQFAPSNFAVYGIVILALLGSDTPLFLGSEVREGTKRSKHVNRFVWWGVGLTCLVYLAGTFGVYVVVPPDQAGSMLAAVEVIQRVLGAPAAFFAGVVLLLGQVALLSAYILMTSRMLVVVSSDRRLPVSLTCMNRYGVPVRSILCQGAIIIAVATLALVFAPGLFITNYNSANMASIIYNLLQGSASVLWTISTIQLFGLALALFFSVRERAAMTRWQRTLMLCLPCIGIGASLIGIWDTIASSWVPTLLPDTRWTEWIVGITLLSLLAGWLLSEIPRIRALLDEQQRIAQREKSLRTQLQAAYDQQEALMQQLQGSHYEQEVLVLQQQELLAEVDRLYREQAKAAVTDAITGLPNHRAVMASVDEELARCERTSGSCAILFVDLDHFKRVNDTWGHRAGDLILREMAARLRATIRLQDFVGRYGGEEFALVLTDIDVTVASEIAERLRVAVNAEPCLWEPEDGTEAVAIGVSASIGVAVYGLHGTSREVLLEKADQAMYEAKQGGRNRVRVAGVIEKIEENDVETRTPPVKEMPTVHVLTTVASIHDPGTDEHSHRLVDLAEGTARRLGRSDEEIHLVRLGALLHDIGKIGIPDAILHKPGPLTNEEWNIMRQHPELGRQILTQAGGVFTSLARIVVAHHERWDGRGYPAGLAQEAIPLAARILAVVDSFDAMTSRRVYREPLSIAAACAELQRCSGSQYDPHVIDAFLTVLTEFEQQKRAQIQDAALQEQPISSAV